jgi:soluble P-type ATPase
MLEIRVPGGPHLRLSHLVCDFNGTLAVDGVLIPGVRERFEILSKTLSIHVLTADTHGTAASALAGAPCGVRVLGPGPQDEAKLAYIQGLGAEACCAVGNGMNDRLMLAGAGFGIGVLEGEGAAFPALAAARVVARDIGSALDLLARPLRVTATLRLL